MVGLPVAPISSSTSIHGSDLLFGLRMAEVDDMQQKVSLHYFFQGGFECLHQPMRQFSNKTDGIGQQNVVIARKSETTRCRIKSSE